MKLIMLYIVSQSECKTLQLCFPITNSHTYIRFLNDGVQRFLFAILHTSVFVQSSDW